MLIFEPMYSIAELYIYPIKSLGGIALTESLVQARGLENDRRWMLCNLQNEFITQRQLPQMALFKINFSSNGFNIHFNHQSFEIPFAIMGNTETVKVWDDECIAIEYSEGSTWFTNMLSVPCKLFYMPNNSIRKVDIAYTTKNDINSFSDGFPILIAGQQSLADLNTKLTTKININQFRPNIVFNGGNAFDEDNFNTFTINGIHFKSVKPCSRCVMITINQSTAITNIEPLKTLATYRTFNNNVLFGINAIALQHNGIIKVGNELKLL